MLKTWSELAAAALVRCAECGAVGQSGTTALDWAASNNSLEMAELLLGAGASVDAKNRVRAGCTCLGAGC